MRAISPTQRITMRLALRRESAKATARAFAYLADQSEGTRFGRACESQSRRIEACATSIHWRVVTPPNEPTRVIIRNQRDCNSRFCALSAARNATKTVKKVRALVDEIHVENPDARALFLTLTLPAETDLRRTSVAPLERALKRFWAMPDVKAVTLGQLTAIEASCAGTPEAPYVHVHAHCIVYVPASYFANGVPAVHQTTWARWWQTAARLNRKPIVDIRACRGFDGSTNHEAVLAAVRECAKYAVSTNIFQHTSHGIEVDARYLAALFVMFRNRRLLRYGRLFKASEKLLKAKARQQSNTQEFGEV